MHTQRLYVINPFVIFWLGVLTGALLVGIIFLYRFAGDQLGADVLRTSTQPTYKTSSTYSAPLYTQPLSGSVNAGDPSPW